MSFRETSFPDQVCNLQLYRQEEQQMWRRQLQGIQVQDLWMLAFDNQHCLWGESVEETFQEVQQTSEESRRPSLIENLWCDMKSGGGGLRLKEIH